MGGRDVGRGGSTERTVPGGGTETDRDLLSRDGLRVEKETGPELGKEAAAVLGCAGGAALLGERLGETEASSFGNPGLDRRALGSTKCSNKLSAWF